MWLHENNIDAFFFNCSLFMTETRPTVCGGAALLITLRGIGILEDKFKEQREKLEVCRKFVNIEHFK